MLGMRGGVDVVSCGMREGDKIDRQMEKENRIPGGKMLSWMREWGWTWADRNLLWTKRTALPQQIPTTTDEKRGRKLTEVRWIESCVAVISERKNEPRRKGEELA